MIVTLGRKLKAALKLLPGTYFREFNAEYEKFWEHGGDAIWYDSHLGRWIFGNYIDPITWLYSEDDVIAPQLVTNWKNRQGRQIESDDILIHHPIDSGKYILYIMTTVMERGCMLCALS